ncbi:zinc ribbon domain-containing protein [Stackebrandtia nassauensis]|uniref:Uncharacterized protein n=1 Tax=Stackebrandtia nassauensis (strain DSM 44728 / CIP 108903 / NRRL B-16338 / NBRC 102104 / LLR-40K-21) TaxID=446470 RepID=D3Q8L5_STANL|nr:C4-type zinc ribbon domain-containing protein [Stackebrandtia nassauensis]ADD44457.1 protein of unknown function DUF164 [Stackebrandtia nassauensis DSM 44728]
MRANPADQRRLLDLQQADTSLTQLAHRRANLPEEAEIVTLRQQVNELADRAGSNEATVGDLDRDIAKVEREIDQVRRRADTDRERQASGKLGPKELEGIAHELETLARRQSELEDQELDLMEQREQKQAAAEADARDLADKRTALAEIEKRRDEALAAIDAELAAERSTREGISVDIPEDLRKLYEKIRRTKPIAAALLRQRRCESCRLEQSGAELADLRAADESDVVRCDNCGAILVRTEESGL